MSKPASKQAIRNHLKAQMEQIISQKPLVDDAFDDNQAAASLPKPENHSEVDENSHSEYKRLLHKGIALLSLREHSVHELHNKLSARTDNQAVLLAVIDELSGEGYVSDERFVESYVRARQNKGFGPVKIRQELQQKGVSNDLIAEYLSVHSAIWFEKAQQQYDKKYGDKIISDYNVWSKYARFLRSRGFTMEQIQVTLPQVQVE